MKQDINKTTKINYVTESSLDHFSESMVEISGYRVEGNDECIGLYSHYVFALADNMGLRDEYLDYHRERLKSDTI